MTEYNVCDGISQLKESIEYFFSNINTEEKTMINTGAFLSEPAGVDIILITKNLRPTVSCLEILQDSMFNL